MLLKNYLFQAFYERFLYQIDDCFVSEAGQGDRARGTRPPIVQTERIF